MTSSALALRKVTAFIRLGRPHFLLAGIMMHALGVAAALCAGASLDWAALLLGQLVISSTQWMVHYANDYFDAVADRFNPVSTVWSGGSRVIQRGELPPRVAYRTALVLAAIACVGMAALVLLAGAGPAALLLAGAALFCSWTYSAPPLRWLSTGFGEAVTALVVAVLTPALGFYLQAGSIPLWFLVVVWPAFCLQFAFQLCVSFPDERADALAGKRTLAVRDPRLARNLYIASIAAAYLAVPLMLVAGLPVIVPAALLASVPLALWLLRRAARGGLREPRLWVSNEWGHVLLLGLAVMAEAAAFLWAAS